MMRRVDLEPDLVIRTQMKKSKKHELTYRAEKKTVPLLMLAISLAVLVYVLNYVNFDIEHGIGASAIIFASFGGSAFLLFMTPHTASSNIRRFVKAYSIGGILGTIGYFLVPYLSIYLTVAIIIPVVALILEKTDSVHSPAISLTFAFILYHIGVLGIVIVAVAIVILVSIRIFLEKAVFILERKVIAARRATRR